MSSRKTAANAHCEHCIQPTAHAQHSPHQFLNPATIARIEAGNATLERGLEHQARAEERIKGSSLPFLIFRVFSLLGPSFPVGRFPMSELEALLADEEIFLEADGSRDFLHVADAARGI